MAQDERRLVPHCCQSWQQVLKSSLDQVQALLLFSLSDTGQSRGLEASALYCFSSSESFGPCFWRYSPSNRRPTMKSASGFSSPKISRLPFINFLPTSAARCAATGLLRPGRRVEIGSIRRASSFDEYPWCTSMNARATIAPPSSQANEGKIIKPSGTRKRDESGWKRAWVHSVS
jgi:hypothetical protein